MPRISLSETASGGGDYGDRSGPKIMGCRAGAARKNADSREDCDCKQRILASSNHNNALPMDNSRRRLCWRGGDFARWEEDEATLIANGTEETKGTKVRAGLARKLLMDAKSLA